MGGSTVLILGLKKRQPGAKRCAIEEARFFRFFAKAGRSQAVRGPIQPKNTERVAQTNMLPVRET